jgi:hypothetical protein
MAHAQPPPVIYRPITLPLASTPAPGRGETLTDQVIEARIADVNYIVLTDATVTICTVVLDTGYSVRGACTCTDPEKFDAAAARQCAYGEAMRKLRTLFGFLATESQYLYTANTWHLRGGV